MQFSCLQENLSRGLSIVSRFISSRPQLPILANILISAQNGELTLKATNLESGIAYKIGAKIEKEGEITVPAKTLTEFINQLPAEKVEILLEENSLKIVSQNFKATLAVLSAAEFPPLPSASGKPGVSFKKEEIFLPVSLVAFAAAQDESRPVLSGIKIFSSGKGLTLVATDGFRLSLFRLSKNLVSPLDLILPARTLTEAIRILAEEEEGELGLEISQETNQTIFSLGKAEIVCRLLEGQFPNFEKIIPTSFTTQVIIAKEELFAAIKTAVIFAREAANVVKFKIANSKLQIEANAPQVGENTTEVEAKVEGEDGEIAFNCRFLQDLLAVMPGGELVFEMSGPLSPGVFKPPGDETFTHIIMPVRVQS